MGSLFLATVAPVPDVDGFAALLDTAATDHPDASHHCWAYRVGEELRFSDDGEPAGTAGRPMLEVLLKRDLDRVGAVVVRYFGGRKLGAGGLARAYAGAVARAAQRAGDVWVPDRVRIRVRAPFSQTDNVLRTLPLGRRSEPRFDPYGMTIEADVIVEEREALERALRESTRGQAEVEAVDGDGS